jgi:PAS domain S-box-containing protein
VSEVGKAMTETPSRPARGSREYHELMLDAIGEGVLAIDAGGRITFINPSAARMLGWSRQELLGREQHATIHHTRNDGRPYPPADCPILAAIRDGQVHRQDADVLWRKDGSSFPVDYIATPIREPETIIGAVLAFRDVSEQQDALRRLAAEQTARAEEARLRELVEEHAEEARRAMQSLSRINRELDQFAYVASHDLKAPLRGIASLAQWISEDIGDKLGEESATHLRLLQARVHRMEALIDALLQYSRAGRLRNKVEPVDVATLLREVVEMASPPASAVIEIAPGMPTIESERLPLQQVFLNLVTNALKHSGRADTRVSIGVQNEGTFYEFTVADNGPGIPRRFQTKIWELFQTLQPRDKVEGAGIGLALVKKNVEARGGTAWVESEEGEGATFHFLWRKRPDEDGGS